MISIDPDKASDKNPTPIHDKNSQEFRNKEEQPQLDKEHLLEKKKLQPTVC